VKEDLATIHAALARLEQQSRPGIAKARDPRDGFRCTSHAAFVAAVDYLLTLPGRSVRSIAREMGVDHVTLGDWLAYGDQKRCQIPSWAVAALPKDCLFVYIKHMLAWGENDNAVGQRTGTGG
jgi:hypothetical protein